MMRILIFWLLSLTAVSVVGGQGKFSADVFILMGIFWTAPAVLFLTLAYFAETLLIKSRLSLVALPLGPILGIVPPLLFGHVSQWFSQICLIIGLFWMVASLPRVIGSFLSDKSAQPDG